MRPQELIVRCYAERVGNQWEAFCLNFSLAAQGDTLDEAKQKLEEQLKEFVHDVLAGDDRDHASYLLSRRAPAKFWLRYWYIYALCRVAQSSRVRKAPEAKEGISGRPIPFKEVLPLVPALC